MPGLSRPVQASSAKDMFEGAYIQYREKWFPPLTKETLVALLTAAFVGSIPYCLIRNFESVIEEKHNFTWFFIYFFSVFIISGFASWFVYRRKKREVMNSVKWQKLYVIALIKEYEDRESTIPEWITQAQEWAKERTTSLNSELEEVKQKKAEAQKLLKKFD